ncbi:hypothetical protein LCGC14_1774980 [marine sediment metagenome]|uniref:dATP/dGTP diphosphohydrolase N-terminal domain-containing protein n=1 Tax=marine sediment metagenome TaxID=412755 RepID=A0A0F9JC27_9ZZZZ
MGKDKTAERKKIYISGPITPRDGNTVLGNVNNAVVAARELYTAGFAPLCPHLSVFMDLDQELSWGEFMKMDKPWVLASDAVLRLEGESKGADLEERWANKAGIPVFRAVETIATFFYSDHTAFREWKQQRVAKLKGEYNTPVSAPLVVCQCDPGECVCQAQLESNKNKVTGAFPDGYRYDLIPPVALRRLAKVFHEGAMKHGEHNWKGGMSVATCINKIMGHLTKYQIGSTEEDHLGNALCRAAMMVHSEEEWPELNGLEL